MLRARPQNTRVFAPRAFVDADANGSSAGPSAQVLSEAAAKRKRRERNVRMFSKFMILWAVASKAWLIIQIVSLFQTQNASGLNLTAFIVFTVGAILWAIYGVYGKDKTDLPILVGSVVSLTLGSLMIGGIVKYREDEQ